MKRALFLLFLPLLIMSGCANTNAEETGNTLPVETQPAGCYVAGSTVEQQTNGAVRQYDLPDDRYTWLKMMGDQLLLATDSERVQLRTLSGDPCAQIGITQLEQEFLNCCESMFNGFAYYDPSCSSVIFLDTQLNPMKSILLPSDASYPVVSPDSSAIFYCCDNQIRAIDTERNIARTIKEASAPIQNLVGAYFNGNTLLCAIGDSLEHSDSLYVSTQNGQTQYTENGILTLSTYEDNYLAIRKLGTVIQRIVGTQSGEAKLLNVSDSDVVAAFGLGGVIGFTTHESSVLLNYYDLSSGTKMSSVMLEGFTEIKSVVEDKLSGYVWLLAADQNADTLLRWDINGTPVQEEGSVFETLYTEQMPDETGLQSCQERVNGLNKTYGVRIRIWQEAIKYPGGHLIVAEHQTAAINGFLDQLEAVLAEFPKNFLLKSVSSRIRICIVRSVDAKMESVHYWDENDAFIVIPINSDVRNGFLKGLGYIVDSHVLGNSSQYDYWNDLNPEGFSYGVSNDTYLTGDERAFIDSQSMRSAPDDRSRILYEAMQPDNAELFQSQTMQNKLLFICQAIRDAWNLERNSEAFPWEQYLTMPLAP